MNDQLGKCEVEAVVSEGEMLGNSRSCVDVRKARADRCHKGRRRVDRRDGVRAQTCHQFRSKCSGSAPDIQCPLPRPYVGLLGEPLGQRLGIPTACRPARDLRSTSRIPPPWRCGQADACRAQSGGHGGGDGRACRRHGEGHGSILCSRLATFVGVVASVQPAMTLNLRLSALIDSDRLMDVNAGKRQPRVDARLAPS